MKTRLTLEVDYDPEVTDPEGLAVAMDRMLETASSIPNVWEEYGNPTLGEFLIAESPPQGPATDPCLVVVNVSGGIVQDVFCSRPDTRVLVVDWDCQDSDPSDDGIVQVSDRSGRTTLAAVAEFPASPLQMAAGSDVEAALEAAGLSLRPHEGEPSGHVSPQAPQRYVLYDFDSGRLASTTIYDSYQEAVDDASQVNDVIVVPFIHPQPSGN
jgi:hypothetical protein